MFFVVLRLRVLKSFYGSISAVEFAAFPTEFAQIFVDVPFNGFLKLDERIILNEVVSTGIGNQFGRQGMDFADEISVEPRVFEKLIEGMPVADLNIELPNAKSVEPSVTLIAERALETRDAVPNPCNDLSVERSNQIGMNVFDLVVVLLDICRVLTMQLLTVDEDGILMETRLIDLKMGGGWFARAF